jgi:hypothetical protein
MCNKNNNDLDQQSSARRVDIDMKKEGRPRREDHQLVYKYAITHGVRAAMQEYKYSRTRVFAIIKHIAKGGK